MTTPADLVRDSCARLAGYRDTLEGLIAEPCAPSGSVGMAPRPADAPLPGNAPAFGALMVIWEAVPRLEARLRYELTSHPGRRRGGSAGNLLDALAAIPRLAAGLDRDTEAWTASVLEWLADVARAVPDIDEAQQWRLIRGRACPYCGCWAIRVLLDGRGNPTRRVECFSGPVVRDGRVVRCADGTGMRPVAVMTIDGLEWADGLVESPPDLEG